MCTFPMAETTFSKHTHTHTHTNTEEDHVEHLHLKDTEREIQVPPQRAFVSLRSESLKNVLSGWLYLT